MDVRTVDFHPLAARELRAVFRWYARRSMVAAWRFTAAVERVMERIATAAEQGAPYRQAFRWMRLHRFPYSIYYEIRDPLSVLVYAVAHTGRRPGYWLRRSHP